MAQQLTLWQRVRRGSLTPLAALPHTVSSSSPRQIYTPPEGWSESYARRTQRTIPSPTNEEARAWIAQIRAQIRTRTL
jgi:hypothetical protein